MVLASTRSWLVPALVVGALVIALAGQAATDALAPSQLGDSTMSSLGMASMSYLAGIRTFAGSVLWNRLDPVMHQYYGGVSLKDQRYMLSTIAAVEWLYPTLEDPYYVGSWLLAENGRVPEGLAMARRGLAELPRSGTLHAGYAQLLQLHGGLDEAVNEGKVAIAEDMEWRSPGDQLDAYATVEQVFRAAGEESLARQLAARIDEIDAAIGHTADSDVHDHNGDGKPDH